MAQKLSALLGFYLGKLPDTEGRMIEEIWTWNHQRLESVHNYIQWLFPLSEPSGFNPRAPLVSPQDAQAFQQNDDLRARLLRSLQVMLNFYGLALEHPPEESPRIERSEAFVQRRRHWINPFNHNYLRLTRILGSLRLLGLKNYARALFECLDEIYRDEGDRIGAETYGYWLRASGVSRV